MGTTPTMFMGIIAALPMAAGSIGNAAAEEWLFGAIALELALREVVSLSGALSPSAAPLIAAGALGDFAADVSAWSL